MEEKRKQNSLEENNNWEEEQAIEQIIALLDAYNEEGGSRMKIQVTESAETKKVYHHGRCDVCSPFARGDAYDVLE